MSDVFISYSRKDKAFVQQLHQALLAQKRDVWVDWEDIPATADWWREIQGGIDAANTFIFVISPESAQSKICYDEIAYAVTANKRIIPLLYQTVANNVGLHPNVTSHNWLIFEGQDFNASFAALVKAMDTDLSHVRTHTRLLTRAREWEQGQKDKSYLLAGIEIEEGEAWLSQSHTKDPLPTNLHTDYILASRKAQRQRQQQLLIGAGVAVVISLSLAILSFILGNIAAAERDRAYEARDTAEVAEGFIQFAYETAIAAQETAQFFIPRVRVVPDAPINIYAIPDPESEVLGRIENTIEVQLFGITPDQEFFQVGIGETNTIIGWMWTRDLAERSSSTISIQARVAIFNPRNNTTIYITPTPNR